LSGRAVEDSDFIGASALSLLKKLARNMDRFATRMDCLAIQPHREMIRMDR
jgi:hypothetical protein